MNKYLSLLCILLISCSCTSATSEKENKHLRLKLQWSFEFIDDVNGLSLITTKPDLINDAYVLINIDSGITLLDVETGELLWHKKSLSNGSGFVNYQLNYDSNNIYFKVDGKDLVYSYSIANGEKKWSFKNKYEYYDFINDYLYNDKLYLAEDKYSISILDVNGNFIKRIELPDSYAQSIYVEEDLIYISQGWGSTSQGANGQILCYSEQSENLKWVYKTNKGRFYHTKLYEFDNMLLCGSLGEVVALNKNTGEIIWKKLGINSYRICLSDNNIYINNSHGIYSLDIHDGKKKWYVKLGDSHSESNVAYANGRVYHAHSGTLYVLDAETGEVLDRVLTSPDGTGFYNVTAKGNRVYAQSDWFIYAYEMQ